jgi:hypothetical protein
MFTFFPIFLSKNSQNSKNKSTKQSQIVQKRKIGREGGREWGNPQVGSGRQVALSYYIYGGLMFF